MGLGKNAGNGRDSGGLLGARAAEVVFDESSHWADGDRAYAHSANEIDRDAVVRWIAGLQHPKASIEPVLGYSEPLTIGEVMGQPHPDEAPFLRSELRKSQACQSVALEDAGQDRAEHDMNTRGQTARASQARTQDCEHGAQSAAKMRHFQSGQEAHVELGLQTDTLDRDYEREKTPSVFERVVLGNTVMHIAFGVLCAAFVFCIMMLAGAGKASAGDAYARVLPAIEHVESGGKSDAVGDGGRAVGILQIHPVTVEDANRIARLRKLNVSFTLADRTDAVKSRAIFRIVSDHYSLGKGDEVVARRWNGGPKGETKASTEQYWAKVRAAMTGGGK